jgi:hypothetical protein
MKSTLVLALAACGSPKDRPAPVKGDSNQATKSECAEYAKKTADLMYVGFERGSHGMAPYVKPEFVTAFAAPVTAYCVEHLPKDHVQCVAKATSAADADRCPLDPATKDAMKPVLSQVTKDAIQNVTSLPATDAECHAAATVVLTSMQAAASASPGAKLPTQEQIAALCIRDRWTADFVRCTATNGVDCKATPNVKPGLVQLVKDAQVK